MRLVLVFLLTIYVVACGGNNSNYDDSNGSSSENIRPSDLDLSGTWLYRSTTDIYRQDTKEYLYTNYFYITYVFDDTENGIKFERCSEIGGLAAYGVKTDSSLYMYVNEEAFIPQSESTFSRVKRYTDEDTPELELERLEELIKISEGVSVDGGYFEISGANVNVVEDDHVCLAYSYRSLGTIKDIEILLPYFNDSLSLSLSYYDDLSVGRYTYIQHDDSNQFLYLDVYSNSNEFWDAVGSNILAPETANIDITAISDNVIEGQFSFTGQDDEPYEGAFSISLP